MKRLQVIVLFLVPIATSAQDNSIERDIGLATFDLNELHDSAIRKIQVLKYYYDYDFAPWNDTLYEATFNDNGKIIYEKIVLHQTDSIIKHFHYNKNNLQLVTTHFYSSYANDIRTDEFDETGNKKCSHENGYTINYFYDSKARLSRVEKSGNSSYKKVSFYSYNNMDSITRISHIESEDHKKDSIIEAFIYDDKGRLIEKSKRPSNTYIKTFDIGCSVGLYYYEIISYDSFGNKIEIKNKNNPGWPKSIYEENSYKKISYIDNGYIVEVFDFENKLQETHVYNSYHFTDSSSYDPPVHYLR